MNFLKNIFQKQKPIETTLTITSSNGFHLRPIAQLANEAKQFDALITIIAYEEEVSATQVPKILSLSLRKRRKFHFTMYRGRGSRSKYPSLKIFYTTHV